MTPYRTVHQFLSGKGPLREERFIFSYQIQNSTRETKYFLRFASAADGVLICHEINLAVLVMEHSSLKAVSFSFMKFKTDKL